MELKYKQSDNISNEKAEYWIWCDFDRASSLICGNKMPTRCNRGFYSDQQLENHSTKYHRQQPLYNTLELLMMGIVVPETCWASNKICNKNLCSIQLAFYFHIFYEQNLMYLITHPCFYVWFTDIQYLAEYDRDRQEHVGVTTNCKYKYNFNISPLLGFMAWIVY